MACASTPVSTSPGKSSQMGQHPAAISRGGLGLVKEDRVRRTLWYQKDCRTEVGDTQLGKEADTTCGHPEGRRSHSSGPAEW